MNERWLEQLTESIGDDSLIERERLIVEITEMISELMHVNNISKVDLAKKIGHKPSYITKLLSGHNNFTIATLAKIFVALGKSLQVQYSEKNTSCRVFHGVNVAEDQISSGTIKLPRTEVASRKQNYLTGTDLIYELAA